MLKFADFDIVFQEVPGEVTLALNISNCPNNCPGCHSAYLMKDVGMPLTENAIDDLLSKYGKAITCVCFMGGDAEPAEVQRIASYVKCNTKCKTAWYSGRGKLPECFSLQCLDFLKLGPYIEKFGGLDAPTTNQHFYKITDGVTMEEWTYKFLKTNKSPNHWTNT